MKKYVIAAIMLILVVAMALAISGCGDKTPPQSSRDDTARESPGASEDATSPTPPSPPPPPADPLAGGGAVRVTDTSEYPFTPSSTGVWIFLTSDNGDSDPLLTIKGPGGILVAEDDDGADGYNSFIILQLNGGTTYTIEAGYYDTNTGSYTLTVAPAGIIPAGGGEVRVNGSEGYAFTPNESGDWEFLTSDNGSSDPYIKLFDADGKLIDSDDDGGEGSNSRLMVTLTAGTTYCIGAADFWGDGGSYTLTVSKVVESALTQLPSGGASVYVNGDTKYEFTPNQSGTWTFRTSDSGGDDPQITIYDITDTMIAYDDDTEGYDAVIVIDMIAGTTYIVEVNFWYGGTHTTLSVTYGASAVRTDSLRVDSPDDLLFTPDETGIWIFYTSDNGSSDPMLAIYNPNDGGLILEDDDGWEGLNSLLTVLLMQGETYTISLGSYGGASASYTLTAKAPSRFPGNGGNADVDNVTGFTFIPDSSGSFLFQTSNNGSSDPYIEVYDANGNYIDGDDDSGGGLNAMVRINLNAGSTYYILVSYYNTGVGNCTLSITKN